MLPLSLVLLVFAQAAARFQTIWFESTSSPKYPHPILRFSKYSLNMLIRPPKSPNFVNSPKILSRHLLIPPEI